MGGQLKLSADAITTLMTTELDSLANGSASALGTAYANQTNLNEFGDFELTVTFGGNATVDTTVDLYLVPATDGTNYNDGSSSVQPANFYRGSWVMRATTAHKLTIHGVILPPVPFKVLVLNGSGQNFPASGSTVKMVGYRQQYT